MSQFTKKNVAIVFLCLLMAGTTLTFSSGCTPTPKEKSREDGSGSPDASDSVTPSPTPSPTPLPPVEPTAFYLTNPEDDGTTLTWQSIQLQGFSGIAEFTVTATSGTVKVCKLTNNVCSDWNQAGDKVMVSADDYIQIKLDYGANPPMSISTAATLGNYSISTVNDFYDPDFSKVVLLMRMDNSGTTFVETSQNRLVSNPDGVTQVTGAIPFGNAAKFDATHGPITVPDSSDWNIGTGAYTVEAKILFETLPIQGGAVYLLGSFWPGIDTNWLLWMSGDTNTTQRLHVFHGRGANGGIVNTSYSSATLNLTTNTWYDFAFTYDGSNLRFFKDGLLLNTIPQTIGFGDSVTSIPLCIGSNYVKENKLHGLMDEVRITKGKARYSENYTPSARPHFVQ